MKLKCEDVFSPVLGQQPYAPAQEALLADQG